MAKKERWQPENAALSNNPFASLAGLKTSTESAEKSPEIVETKPESVKLPKVKSTRIERAQRGGKTVTVVTFHGEPSDEAKTAWLKAMKKELGVGGAIEDDVVILQGDQRDRLKN